MTAQVSDIVAGNDAYMDETGAFVTPDARVVRTSHLDETIYFTINNPDDVIQSEHFAGRFYEPEELAIMRRRFPMGGRFLDIGANVGNHALYMAKFLRARHIVLIEPNPLAIPLLESNIFLNGIERVCDRRHIGLGLSDGKAERAFIRTGQNNLGGARVKEGEGDIPLCAGDDLFRGERFDLVKIDVEGMEMKVLAGMSAFLHDARPPIFIEVDRRNYGAFETWLTEAGYHVLEKFQRYPTNTNFMIEATG